MLGQVRQVIPEATRPPPISFLLPHPIPRIGSQFKPPPGPTTAKMVKEEVRCDAVQLPAPWGLNLPGSARALQQVLLVHGLHAAFPGAPSKLRAGRWQLAVTFHLPLRPCRCAPRRPALSSALLATWCEAARRASCAKARGEGGGWPAAKGIAALPPGPDPCIPRA